MFYLSYTLSIACPMPTLPTAKNHVKSMGFGDHVPAMAGGWKHLAQRIVPAHSSRWLGWHREEVRFED
jgi:hypothetical protein